MNNLDRQDHVIREIREKYGDEINLATSPLVLIEIIRNYRNILDNDGGGGTLEAMPGIGGTLEAMPGIGGTLEAMPGIGGTLEMGTPSNRTDEILKAILRLQKQVVTVEKKLDQLVPPGGNS
ncbi:hypothetical protein [Nitrosospira multiformis]|uniref:Uncharacterized protein n=1 Tax=Nitrosospira multiformis TaxID=1231 RepID=A0A1I7IZT3_9PROT|nr:hypothetical protein [Nitrosospira multiformis]SFU78438.1 hypothetical protein SAMN05216417_1355 [Nitrosospira multiformis]